MASYTESNVETREYLKPYLGTLITVEGTIRAWSEYLDYNLKRAVPSVLLQDVDTIQGQARIALTSHVYVGQSDPIKNTGADIGDRVQVEVAVYRYQRKDPQDYNKIITQYGLREPRSVEVVRWAERAPKPEPGEAPVPSVNGHTAVATAPKPAPAAPSPEAPPAKDIEVSEKHLVLIDVLALVKKYGFKPVQKALAAAKMMEEDD